MRGDGYRQVIIVVVLDPSSLPNSSSCPSSTRSDPPSSHLYESDPALSRTDGMLRPHSPHLPRMTTTAPLRRSLVMPVRKLIPIHERASGLPRRGRKTTPSQCMGGMVVLQIHLKFLDWTGQLPTRRSSSNVNYLGYQTRLKADCWQTTAWHCCSIPIRLIRPPPLTTLRPFIERIPCSRNLPPGRCTFKPDKVGARRALRPRTLSRRCCAPKCFGGVKRVPVAGVSDRATRGVGLGEGMEVVGSGRHTVMPGFMARYGQDRLTCRIPDS